MTRLPSFRCISLVEDRDRFRIVRMQKSDDVRRLLPSLVLRESSSCWQPTSGNKVPLSLAHAIGLVV